MKNFLNLVALIFFIQGCQLYRSFDQAEDIFSNTRDLTGVPRWLNYREHLRKASPKDLEKEAELVDRLVTAHGGFDEYMRRALINLAVNYPAANQKKALNTLTYLYLREDTSPKQRYLVAVMIDFSRDLIFLKNRNAKLHSGLDRQTKEKAALEAKIDALTNIEESLARRQNRKSLKKKPINPLPKGDAN